jgi:ABC-type transport system involved in multi-copper enzyme maturation permease subunit
MNRIIRSEWLKVRSTSLWWLMLIGVLAFTAVAIAYNMLGSYVQLNPDSFGGSAGDLHADKASIAANLYTSGQYFGTLLAMVFGILIFTNEFFHQTATATFLATPRRTRVVGGKLIVAILVGIVIALITTVLAVPSGLGFLASQHVDSFLGDGTVLKSVGLNWLAFAIWAVFGLGIGALLRSQILSVIVGLVAMLVGQTVISIGLGLLAAYFHQDWLTKVSYWLPSGASSVMTSPNGAGGIAWWAGALTLLGYGVLAAVIGTLITRRRDIS